jgi:hypothetical protein
MLKSLLMAVACVAVAAPAVRAQMPTAGQAAPGVQLTNRDGRVTLTATQASIRQILAEWERQGQMKVTGAEKITAAPITLTLVDIPEKQALEIVMRGIPGYMAVDRAAASTSASASRYDRVMIMARAATPVAASPSPTAAGRAMPSQPPVVQTFQPEPAVQPVLMGDEGVVEPGPDRSDVDQFQRAAGEPPMPETPVVNPYPNAYPGSPYAGAAAGAYGGNATAAAASGAAAPPETQFDYANPQKYFEQRRLQQQAAQPVPQAVPTAGAPIAGTSPSPMPSATPSAAGTLARPGIAPPAQQATPTVQGEFFNPYNLPADWVPPTQPSQTTPSVEPDRSKYANPYNQPTPPGE